MLKKVILGTLFAGLIAVLVIGAINRTVDKSEDSTQSAGHGRDQNQSDQEVRNNQQEKDIQGGGGQGNGGGRSAEERTGQYPNYQDEIDEWITYDGIVTQLPAEGVDLVMETADGEMVVGTGPLSLAELGVEMQVGDAIEVRGYWEDDELKAAEFTLLATGQIVALRDGWGRPVWSGSAQNERGGQYQMVEDDVAESAGQGSGGQRIGWSGNGGRGEAEEQENPNVGQAEVNEWITLQGSVIDVDGSTMVIILSSGELVTVEGRPWSFAQQQGFSAAVGDEVALTGFFEGEKFEAGLVANITNNLVINIRQENGRPLWSGGSRDS
jgi:hypothetical protein